MPREGSPLLDNWQKEMLKNLNQISICQGMTKLESETFLLKEQEKKRKEIEQQMAHIQTLNVTINRDLEEIGGSESDEDDTELDDLQNIVCSTDPAHLSTNYATRLEIMRKVETKLNKSLTRKSRRLAKIQAEQVDMTGLSRRERNHLEY